MVRKLMAHAHASLARHAQSDHVDDMLARQQDSTASKSRLKAATEAWKAMDAAQRASQTVPLLKQYQAEVNALTRRARTAEAGFTDTLQGLMTAPDPSPALQAAVGAVTRAAKAQAAAATSASEAKAMEEELAGLQSQDVTIRQLTSRVEEMAAQMDARVADAVADREAELSAAHEAEMATAREAERDALRRLALAQDAAVSAKQQAAAAAASSAAEAEAAAASDAGTAAATSLLEGQVARLAADLAAAQAECKVLSERLAGSDSGPQGEVAALQQRLAASEAAHQSLRSALQKAGQRASEAAGRAEAAEAALAAARSDFASESEALRSELAARPDPAHHATLQQELRTLKSTYLGGAAAQDSELGAAALARLRQCEAELSAAQVKCEELQGALLKRQQAQADAEAERNKERAGRVAAEEHLSRLMAGAGAVASPPAEAGADTPPPPTTGQHLAEVLGGSAPPPGQGAAAGQGAPQTPMVQALVAQRDRLRASADAAEAATVDLRDQLSAMSRRADSLAADNTRLYEQLRFHEAMAAGPGRGAGLMHGMGASAAHVGGVAAAAGLALAGGGPGSWAGGLPPAHSGAGGLDPCSAALLRMYWTVVSALGVQGGGAPTMVRLAGGPSTTLGGGGVGATAPTPSDPASADAGGMSLKAYQRAVASAGVSPPERMLLGCAGAAAATPVTRYATLTYTLLLHALVLWLLLRTCAEQAAGGVSGRGSAFTHG